MALKASMACGRLLRLSLSGPWLTMTRCAPKEAAMSIHAFVKITDCERAEAVGADICRGPKSAATSTCDVRDLLFASTSRSDLKYAGVCDSKCHDENSIK